MLNQFTFCFLFFRLIRSIFSSVQFIAVVRVLVLAVNLIAFDVLFFFSSIFYSNVVRRQNANSENEGQREREGERITHKHNERAQCIRLLLKRTNFYCFGMNTTTTHGHCDAFTLAS